MLSTQHYYVVGLFAAENAEAQYNVAKCEHSWTFNPGCLILESTYWTIMRHSVLKLGKSWETWDFPSSASGSGHLL